MLRMGLRLRMGTRRSKAMLRRMAMQPNTVKLLSMASLRSTANRRRRGLSRRQRKRLLPRPGLALLR
jgi:hypothetical protein